MPFGRSKKDKDKDRDEDDKRSALFGRSKSSKSSADTSSNPYAAQPAANDPYSGSSGNSSNPYGSSRSNGPPAYDNGGRSQYSQDKTPVPVGGYGGSSGNRYEGRGGSSGSQDRYGGSSNYGQQSSGYGNSDPYGSSSSNGQASSRQGGYGGFARSNDDGAPDDGSRAALFGDAASRNQRAPANPSSYGNDPYSNNGSGDQSYSNGYGGGGPGGYGDRELTAEEQEEEDVQASKNEIRFLKQQDVASTRNARRIAEMAEQTGRETLARLGQQGERIHNAERNLDQASVQNRIAQDKAAELKTLNRSMFAVHVGNPFTKGRREEEANRLVAERHRSDRGREDATRRELIDSQSRQGVAQRGLGGGYGGDGEQGKRNLAQRSKYQFEADSEDEGMENEIDDNLEAIHRGARTLNLLGKAMGEELESQNKHIQRITGKTDQVDVEIAQNRARLDRIH